ncbi:hypothetical protein LWC05_14420 [Acetobacter sicerae]|uniref:Uncharacterized protein n=1 Tax=Acetobacter sicerae TaxID=85325 RepID=A0ABS8W0P5_9PROT|nr:hypothetical protein [Acetobacter sicerae]MCE0745069.1 hypothetical protein [Acetobacter sicerae]
MVFPHPVPRIIYGQSLLLASKKLASKIPNQLILFEIIFALMPDTDNDHAARRRSVELAAGLSPLVGAVFKAL